MLVPAGDRRPSPASPQRHHGRCPAQRVAASPLIRFAAIAARIRGTCRPVDDVRTLLPVQLERRGTTSQEPLECPTFRRFAGSRLRSVTPPAGSDRSSGCHSFRLIQGSPSLALDFGSLLAIRKSGLRPASVVPSLRAQHGPTLRAGTTSQPRPTSNAGRGLGRSWSLAKPARRDLGASGYQANDRRRSGAQWISLPPVGRLN